MMLCIILLSNQKLFFSLPTILHRIVFDEQAHWYDAHLARHAGLGLLVHSHKPVFAEIPPRSSEISARQPSHLS